MRDRSELDSAPRGLLVINGVGLAAATGFAVAGMVQPTIAESGSVASPLSRFWAVSSAVRTLSITLPLIVQLFLTRRLSPQLLSVAGSVQLADAAIGIRLRNPGMTVCPAAMGALHLLSARALARQTDADDRRA